MSTAPAPERPPRAPLSEAGTAIVLGSLGALVFLRAGELVPAVLADPRAANVWFDSDIPYRLEAMQNGGGWVNGGAHPLFPGAGHLLLLLGTALTGGPPWLAARLGTALVGGLWVALSYALLRRLRLERVDALLFTAVGVVSAGALFWFTVPESFPLSGAAVAFALLVAATPSPALAALAAACAASGAFVLSSGVVGGLATLAHELRPGRLQRAALALLAGLGLLTGLWALQEWSRETPFFLGARLHEYGQHLYPVTPQRLGEVVPALLVGSAVAPELRNERPSFRRRALPSQPVGVVASLAWAALLALGTARLVRARDLRPFAVAALGGVAALLAIHASLGREMFLYAMSAVPLLLPVAACAALPSRGRAWVRALAVVLLVTAAANNGDKLVRAAESARLMGESRVLAGARR